MIEPNVLFLKIMIMGMFSFTWRVTVISPHYATGNCSFVTFLGGFTLV